MHVSYWANKPGGLLNNHQSCLFGANRFHIWIRVSISLRWFYISNWQNLGEIVC